MRTKRTQFNIFSEMRVVALEPVPTECHLSSTKGNVKYTFISNVLIGTLVFIMIEAELAACWFCHSLFSRNPQIRLR